VNRVVGEWAGNGADGCADVMPVADPFRRRR